MDELTGVVLFFCSIISCLIVFIVILLNKIRELNNKNYNLTKLIYYDYKNEFKEKSENHDDNFELLSQGEKADKNIEKIIKSWDL